MHNNITWDFVKKYRYNDEIFGKSMKLGDAWIVASQAYDILYNNVFNILENELENYYVKRMNEA